MLLFFLLSLIFFIAIMTLISFIGIRRSLLGWGLERGKAIEELVEKEMRASFTQDHDFDLDDLRRGMEAAVPRGTVLIIYDQQMNQLYSQVRQGGKGSGAWMSGQGVRQYFNKLPLHRVELKGSLIGYYRLGPVSFGFDRANARFLESMRRSVWISIILAFVLALLFALLFSKRISKSAQRVSQGVNRLADGDLSIRIETRGPREIALIADSANELGRKLKREKEIRQQWAADIAHDLRTPISALRSQIEGMADGVLDPSRDRLQHNLDELERIELLVYDLGELTQLESPEIRISMTAIQTASFCKELQERFSGQCISKRIVMNCRKTIESFTGDKNLLHRAASNLLSNAIRHTPEGSTIDISVEREGDFVVIGVTNSGRGIPPEELPRVFDRLYRGEYARSSPGTGLGLTIAKKIAELHHGDIRISSSEQGPTIVQIRIRA